MNIGLFADCYTPTVSGVVTSIQQLREGLEGRGHRVAVFTVATPDCHENDPSVYRLPSLPFNAAAGFRLGLPNQRAVDRLVGEQKLDIIHTHTEYTLGWAGKRAARKLGLPLVHTAHTMHEEYRHYLFFGQILSAKAIQAYLRLFLSGFDALVCPSMKAQTYFNTFMPSLRSVVIGNGLSRDRFRAHAPTRAENARTREELGIRSSDRVILFVGRLAREKRVLQLLSALAPLLQRHPHYKALFVGGGPCFERLVQAAENKGIRQQAVFAGTVAWEHIHRYYALADVFVTASQSEVHPITLIEASMSGLPIVAREDEAYAGLVKDGHNGYLVGSDRGLPVRLEELLANESKRLRLSVNSLSLSASLHLEGHGQQIDSLYGQLTERPSA
jgi:1,2-diacylglycerol 3-alpha-glucosyltransferase